jgi:hypothetical protein
MNIWSTVNFFEGKKTYIVSAAMVAHALSGYFSGHPVNVEELLTGLGLSALRRGVSGGKVESQILQLTPITLTPVQPTVLQGLEASFYGTLAPRNPGEGVNRPKRLPNGWRHGESHPFVWKDQVFDKGETAEESRALFARLSQEILSSETPS